MNSIVLELSAFLAVTFFVVSMCNHCPPIKWKGVHPHTSVKTDNHEIRVFATVSGVDLKGCIDNCQRRKVCQYINYYTSAHVCFLIEPLSEPITEDNMVNDDTHFVFGNKSEWAEENWGQNYSVCNKCSERELCTIGEDGQATCTIRECQAPPVIPDAELLGNKYTIGSRLRYRCTDDKTKKSDGIVCKSTGTWSTVNFTCQDSSVSDGQSVTTAQTTTINPTTTTEQTTTINPTTTTEQTTTITPTIPTEKTITNTPTATSEQVTWPITLQTSYMTMLPIDSTPTVSIAHTTTSTPTTATAQVACLITTQDLPIPDDWVTRCQFMVVENKVSKDVAMTDCTKGGGKLVQILNDDKMIVLQRLLIGSVKKYWIDANRENKNSPWKTNNGNPLSISPSYWKDDKNEICAKLHAEENNPHLHDCKCDDKFAFICERR